MPPIRTPGWVSRKKKKKWHRRVVNRNIEGMSNGQTPTVINKTPFWPPKCHLNAPGMKYLLVGGGQYLTKRKSADKFTN